MIVYKITFEKNKHSIFDKLRDDFDRSLNTNVLNVVMSMRIGEEEFNYIRNKNSENAYFELNVTDKRFIDFLQKENFEFELSEKMSDNSIKLWMYS